MNIDYKSTFGDYNKIELMGKEVEVIEEVLNTILVPNPNFWGRPDLLYSFGTSPEKSLVDFARLGLIEFYEYSFKEPNEPEGNDLEYFKRLVDVSRSNNYNVQWLYWRAFNFFRDKGFYLRTNAGEYNYMGLSEENNFHIRKFDTDYEERKQQGDYHKKIEIVKNIILNYSQVIRCGEIDSSRVTSELINNDYLWIFPFMDIDDDISKCYLVSAAKDELKKNMYNDMYNYFF